MYSRFYNKANPEDAVIDVNRLMESPEFIAAAQALTLAASFGPAIDVDAELSRLTPSASFTANPVPSRGDRRARNPDSGFPTPSACYSELLG